MQPPTRVLRLEKMMVNTSMNVLVTYNIVAIHTESGLYTVECNVQTNHLSVFNNKNDYIQLIVIFILNLALFIIVNQDIQIAKLEKDLVK
jgi:hypothetical protein